MYSTHNDGRDFRSFPIRRNLVPSLKRNPENDDGEEETHSTLEIGGGGDLGGNQEPVFSYSRDPEPEHEQTTLPTKKKIKDNDKEEDGEVYLHQNDEKFFRDSVRAFVRSGNKKDLEDERNEGIFSSKRFWFLKEDNKYKDVHEYYSIYFFKLLKRLSKVDTEQEKKLNKIITKYSEPAFDGSTVSTLTLIIMLFLLYKTKVHSDSAIRTIVWILHFSTKNCKLPKTFPQTYEKIFTEFGIEIFEWDLCRCGLLLWLPDMPILTCPFCHREKHDTLKVSHIFSCQYLRGLLQDSDFYDRMNMKMKEMWKFPIGVSTKRKIKLFHKDKKTRNKTIFANDSCDGMSYFKSSTGIAVVVSSQLLNLPFEERKLPQNMLVKTVCHYDNKKTEVYAVLAPSIYEYIFFSKKSFFIRSPTGLFERRYLCLDSIICDKEDRAGIKQHQTWAATNGSDSTFSIGTKKYKRRNKKKGKKQPRFVVCKKGGMKFFKHGMVKTNDFYHYASWKCFREDLDHYFGVKGVPIVSFLYYIDVEEDVSMDPMHLHFIGGLFPTGIRILKDSSNFTKAKTNEHYDSIIFHKPISSLTKCRSIEKRSKWKAKEIENSSKFFIVPKFFDFSTNRMREFATELQRAARLLCSYDPRVHGYKYLIRLFNVLLMLTKFIHKYDPNYMTNKINQMAEFVLHMVYKGSIFNISAYAMENILAYGRRFSTGSGEQNKHLLRVFLVNSMIPYYETRAEALTQYMERKRRIVFTSKQRVWDFDEVCEWDFVLGSMVKIPHEVFFSSRELRNYLSTVITIPESGWNVKDVQIWRKMKISTDEKVDILYSVENLRNQEGRFVLRCDKALLEVQYFVSFSILCRGEGDDKERYSVARVKKMNELGEKGDGNTMFSIDTSECDEFFIIPSQFLVGRKMPYILEFTEPVGYHTNDSKKLKSDPYFLLIQK